MLLKKFFRFMIPSILSMWIFALYSMVDGIFVSRGVGEYALAAVNLSMPFTIFIFSVGLMMATGSSTLINIFLGEGRQEKASDTFNQNLIVLIFIGLVITVIIRFNLDRLAVFLGAGPETFEYVKGYVGWISVFAVFFVVSYNMEIIVKTDGAPQLQMIGVFSCAMVNVILDYLFVIRLNMGVEGAAIATGIAQVVSTTIFICYFKFRGKRLKFRKFHLDLSVYRRIIPLGLSDSLTEMSGGLVIFLFNRMILQVIGSGGLVSYTVISYVNTLALNSMAGIAQGNQPLISFHYGAGKPTVCHTFLRYGLCAAAVFGVFFLALSELAPQLPVLLFLGPKDEALIDASVRALRLYGTAFSIMGFNVVAAGFFTAVDRPVYSFTISLARSLVLLVVCLVSMTALFGGNGIWLTPFVCESLCLLITGYFFLHYRKRRKDAC